MTGLSLLLIPVMAIAGVQVSSPKAAAIPYRLLDVKAPDNASPDLLPRLTPIKIYAFDHIKNCPNR